MPPICFFSFSSFSLIQTKELYSYSFYFSIHPNREKKEGKKEEKERFQFLASVKQRGIYTKWMTRERTWGCQESPQGIKINKNEKN